jgi:hypothetical protein
MATTAVRIEDLLRGFGQAMIDAQAQLDASAKARPVGPEGLRTGVAISESEIDLKATVATDDKGVARLRPLAAEDELSRTLNPGLVSGVRARFVVVPEEGPPRPQRAAPDIRAEVLGLADIERLRAIFGRLEVKPSYHADGRRWIVDVYEPGGQLLRSLQVADTAPVKG